jgi:hypothetical protein
MAGVKDQIVTLTVEAETDATDAAAAASLANDDAATAQTAVDGMARRLRVLQGLPEEEEEEIPKDTYKEEVVDEGRWLESVGTHGLVHIVSTLDQKSTNNLYPQIVHQNYLDTIHERMLQACTENNKCVDKWSNLPVGYILKDNYTNHDGGCKFVCKAELAPKPVPVNDQATEGNGVNDCYASCQTGDGSERCFNGACEKVCSKMDPGLTVNCNVNEECIVGTGSDPNTCVPKPCEDPCDANYETCDAATNRCSLLPRKPKIQVLSTCAKVENCDAKYHLNKCYKCSNLYSFKVTNASLDPVLNADGIPTCLQTNISNGLKATETVDADGVTRYTVKECAAGFDLDSNNNECVNKIKNCRLNSVDGDCLGCDTPYETGTVQLVWGVFEKGYCKTWDEFDAAEQANLTVRQEFCKYYSYKYTSQVSSAVTSLSDGASTCYQCDPDYYFTSAGLCALRKTEFCKTYDPVDATGVCTECEAGYQLYMAGSPNQACNPIVNSTKKIPKCAVYDIDLNCLSCEAGYLFRETGVDQKGYCFEEFQDENCTTQDPVVFKNTAAIKCLKCAKVKGVYYYPRPFSTGINACVFLAARNLCLNHDYNKTDSLNLNNTFVCTLCESDYYLANGICIRRLNTEIRGCLAYKPDEDDCQTYEASTPVSVGSDEFSTEIESVQTLLLNPPDYQIDEKTVNFAGWILSCEIYKNETTCAQCFAPKYLNPFGFEYNTKCISASVNIENCVSYSDAETCDKCFDGYMLSNNQCLLITVENCATYESENKCGSCPSNYPYIDNDGNCALDPRNMFCEIYLISNNAVNLQASKIYECDTCQENYYPDDSSICTLVETFIRKCKYYAGDGLCKECQEGFYLNYDGKKCFINPSFDPFCKTFSYLTECSICEKGHYIGEDGKCVACNKEIFPENCEYCDPDDNSKCLMCTFGSYMTDSGCVMDPSIESVEFVQPYNYFLNQNQDTTAQSGLFGS